jgi:hypothetical protein
MSALDMIAGGGPPPGMPPDIGMPGPPDVQAGQAQAPSGANADSAAADLLGQILDLISQYMSIEPDEEDKAIVAQCQAQMQKVRAKDQQDADKMTQGNVTPRALRAALGP